MLVQNVAIVSSSSDNTLINQLNIKDPNFEIARNALIGLGQNVDTIKDIHNLRNDPNPAINAFAQILHNHIIAIPLPPTVDLVETEKNLVDLFQKVCNENQNISDGVLSVSFISEVEFSDYKSINDLLINKIDNVLKNLNHNDYPVACAILGYGGVNPIILNNLNGIQNIQTNLINDVVNSFTTNERIEIQNHIIQFYVDYQLSLEPLNTVFDVQRNNLVEILNRLSQPTDNRGHIPIPISTAIENILLQNLNVPMNKPEIINNLQVNYGINVNNIASYLGGNNIYACGYQNVGQGKTYRHFDFITTNIPNYNEELVSLMMEQLSNYFNDNAEILTYEINGNAYKLLHLKEYFSKTLNESLDPNIDYYSEINSVLTDQLIGYYEWVAIVKREIQNFNLFFYEEKISNDPNPPMPNNNIKVDRLLLRIIEANILEDRLSTQDLADKILNNLANTNAYLTTLRNQNPNVQSNNGIWTTIQVENIRQILQNNIQNINAGVRTLTAFQSSTNQLLNKNYSLYFYKRLVEKNGFVVTQGIIT